MLLTRANSDDTVWSLFYSCVWWPIWLIGIWRLSNSQGHIEAAIMMMMMMMKCQFHCWRNPEYPEEITDLQPLTDILSYIRPLPIPSTEPGPQQSTALADWSTEAPQCNNWTRIQAEIPGKDVILNGTPWSSLSKSTFVSWHNSPEWYSGENFLRIGWLIFVWSLDKLECAAGGEYNRGHTKTFALSILSKVQ